MISNRVARWGTVSVVEDRASPAGLLGFVSQLRYLKSCVTLDMSFSLSVPHSLHL